jgi:NitT/TauT family transport system substrate-binding protein
MGRRVFRAIVMLAVVLLAGCGDSGGGGKVANGEAVTLKVGVLPIGDVAPLYLGIKKGFYKQEKLTLEPQVMQGGAEVATGVVSGSIQFGFSSTSPLAVAGSKGLPVKIVSQGVQAATSEAEAWDGLMVKGDSPIRSPEDLAGKTVAVNQVKGMNELCIRAVLERKGVDASKIKFLEVPFPEMGSALQKGRVDAISAVEPFVSGAKAAGARSLFSFFAGLQPKLTVATYFTRSDYLAKNEDVVKRFARAMNKSLSYAQSHPDEVRSIVLTYTKIPPQAAKKMKLPYWSPDLNRPSIQLIADETKKLGFAESAPKLDDLIWSGASEEGS